MNAATNHIRMPHFDSAKIHFFRFAAIPFLVFHASSFYILHSAFYILTTFLTTLTPRSKLIFTRYVPAG